MEYLVLAVMDKLTSDPVDKNPGNSVRTLLISDLNAIARDVQRHSPTAVRVLSILDPGTPAPDLGLTPDRHHVARCLDLECPDGPDRETLATILRFGAVCAPDDIVIVHCHAGVSRSPAAALILRHFWGEPLDIGSRPVTPNLRLLALADHSLRLMRHGRSLARLAESSSLSGGDPHDFW